MHPIEVKEALSSMVVLVDTREQDTPALHKRLSALSCPWRREKLDSGDYSCECALPDGTIFSLADKVTIERKMSADEICQNFTRGRKRFVREFDRFQNCGGKPYLLIENTTWEDIFAGNYRSQLNPDSLVASLKAWEARYGTHVTFCTAALTGQMIYKTLYYELKERLERGDADDDCG